MYILKFYKLTSCKLSKYIRLNKSKHFEAKSLSGWNTRIFTTDKGYESASPIVHSISFKACQRQKKSDNISFCSVDPLFRSAIHPTRQQNRNLNRSGKDRIALQISIVYKRAQLFSGTTLYRKTSFADPGT